MNQKYKNNIDVAIKTFVKKVKAKNDLAGIVLLGGLGRNNYFDKFSDVDISVFINKEKQNYPDWLPEFEFNIFAQDGQRIHFNVHQQDLKKESLTCWSDVKKDAYDNGLILYDKNKKLSIFLKNKLQVKKIDYEQKLMMQYVKIPPSCLINPEKQLKRGEIELSHQILSNGIENLVDLLFVINKKFIPHYKWKFKRTFDLKYKPKNFHRNIREAMLVRSFTKVDVERRMKVTRLISSELMRKVENIVSLDEASIYRISCNQFLGRQLLETPFSAQVRKMLMQSRSVTNIQIQKITDLINFHLINNFDTLKKFLKSNLVFSEEEKKILLNLV